MWEYPCVACIGLIFLVGGLFLVWLPLSSVCAGRYHLKRGCDWCCGDPSLN